jgi:hypothetical protein
MQNHTEEVNTAITAVMSGRHVAHVHLSHAERIRLAADLVTGEAVILGMTRKQAAAICRVPVREVAIRAPKKLNGSFHKAWAAASTTDRAKFIREVGVDTVWSALADVVD